MIRSQYDLTDCKDVERLNKLLNPAGISFEYGLLGLYVLIDRSRYSRYTRRKAGRRASISRNEGIRQKVFTLRSEHKSIREIAGEVGISVGIVCEILKEYEEEEETDQLSLYDL